MLPSFSSWLEAMQPVQPVTVNYNAPTADYTPGVGGQSTPADAQGRTVDYVPGRGGEGAGGAVPSWDMAAQAISRTNNRLGEIHGELRNIFGNIRANLRAFRSKHMRGAFEREMLAGIDGIGRSQAILGGELAHE